MAYIDNHMVKEALDAFVASKEAAEKETGAAPALDSFDAALGLSQDKLLKYLASCQKMTESWSTPPTSPSASTMLGGYDYDNISEADPYGWSYSQKRYRGTRDTIEERAKRVLKCGPNAGSGHLSLLVQFAKSEVERSSYDYKAREQQLRQMYEQEMYHLQSVLQTKCSYLERELAAAQNMAQQQTRAVQSRSVKPAEPVRHFRDE